MSFADIEKAIADLGKRAKDGTLTMDDMTGGIFTISNGGVFGGLMSTPIINTPQSAELELHPIENRTVVRKREIWNRPRLYTALCSSHWLVDCRQAESLLIPIQEDDRDTHRQQTTLLHMMTHN